MDISISTTIFYTGAKENCSFEKGLKMLRQAGYRQIEISRKHDDIADKKSIIDSLGVKVWSVHGTLSGDSISLSEELRRKSVEKEFIRMDEAQVYAPCPYVVHYHNRHQNPEIAKAFRKSIEELHEKAIETNLNLAVETAPYKPKQYDRHPDSLEIADFVRSFNSPNLSVCIDLNHSNLNEDLVRVSANCAGLISNIHVSDNHGEWEDHLPPGEGIIDFPKVFKALVKDGYTGPCNIECHISEQLTTQGLEIMYRNVKKML